MVLDSFQTSLRLRTLKTVATIGFAAEEGHDTLKSTPSGASQSSGAPGQPTPAPAAQRQDPPSALGIAGQRPPGVVDQSPVSGMQVLPQVGISFLCNIYFPSARILCATTLIALLLCDSM